MWENKTCELCVYNIWDQCRRFPQGGNNGLVNYPNTLWKHPDESILKKVVTLACAEYKESD